MAKVVIKGAAPRLETVPLEWPVEIEGAEITSVTLCRLSGGAVSALQDKMLSGDATDGDLIAAFADQPAEVLDELDADDFLTLKSKVVDFLPRRLREALEQAAEAASHTS